MRFLTQRIVPLINEAHETADFKLTLGTLFNEIRSQFAELSNVTDSQVQDEEGLSEDEKVLVFFFLNMIRAYVDWELKNLHAKPGEDSLMFSKMLNCRDKICIKDSAELEWLVQCV